MTFCRQNAPLAATIAITKRNLLFGPKSCRHQVLNVRDRRGPEAKSFSSSNFRGEKKKKNLQFILDQNWNFLEQFFHWNLLCPMLPGAQISHRTGGSPRADLPTPVLIEFAKDSLNAEMQLNPVI